MELSEIVRDLGFVEGPVWTGASLLVTSITRGLVYELGLDGSALREYAAPGGGPNGLARAASGTVFAAQGGGGHFDMEFASKRPPGLLRIDPDGTVAYAVEAGMTAPSDCAFGPGGLLWFTDPQENFEIPSPGKVVAYDPVSGTAETVTADDNYPEGFYPNGIAFGLDPSVLYVADTKNRRVLVYDVDGERLSAPRPFAATSGFPDGLAVDSEGNLYVALLTSDVLEVYSPVGELIENIEIPGSRPTNVCFAGNDLETIVVTASKGGRVLVGEAPVRGLRLHTL